MILDDPSVVEHERYHMGREATAMGEGVYAYINMDDNPSDVMTKPLPGGPCRESLIRKMMWDIYSSRE